jgi:hypothetical protein
MDEIHNHHQMMKLWEEITRLKNAIRKHRDARGMDRCHTNDIQLYAVLDGEPVPTDEELKLPPWEEFQPMCKLFHETRQPPNEEKIQADGFH